MMRAGDRLNCSFCGSTLVRAKEDILPSDEVRHTWDRLEYGDSESVLSSYRVVISCPLCGEKHNLLEELRAKFF